jgi:hypothetical protein
MPWRKVRTAAAAFMLSTSAFGMGMADADDNVSQLCKSIGDAGVTHGACVSLGQAANPTALISALCKLPGVPESLGTTNHGQCMKATRAMLDDVR